MAMYTNKDNIYNGSKYLLKEVSIENVSMPEIKLKYHQKVRVKTLKESMSTTNIFDKMGQDVVDFFHKGTPENVSLRGSEARVIRAFILTLKGKDNNEDRIGVLYTVEETKGNYRTSAFFETDLEPVENEGGEKA